jgi:hypothetical protein
MRRVAERAVGAKGAAPAGAGYQRAEQVIALLLPSLGDVLFVAVLLGVALGLQGAALGLDGDAGWNLRIGDSILQHGLPRTEFLLAPTYGQPVVYWEWLSQVCYALAYRLGGLNGVVALAALLVAGTSVGLYAALRARRVPLLLALALAVAGIGLTSITWTARAQLFSLALTLWTSEELWRYWRDGRTRRLWLFPPVLALWANLHGGFVGGLLLLATGTAVAWLFPAGQAPRDQRSARSPSEPFRGGRGRANPRHLSLALLASLAATLLTPWGFGLPQHIFDYLRNPLISRYTQEYQSPDFHALASLLFLGLVLTLAAAWIVVARRGVSGRIPPLAGAHALVWTTLACVSVRFVPLWALIMLPPLGEALTAALAEGVRNYTELHGGQPSLTKPEEHEESTDNSSENSVSSMSTPLNSVLRPRSVSAFVSAVARLSRRLAATDARVGRGIWSAAALVGLYALVARGGAMPGAAHPLLSARFDARTLPVAATARLQAAGLPPGPGYTTYEWGGYLDYALPAYHPFIDSRSDAYPQGLLAHYATIDALEAGWGTLFFDQYGFRWALLPARAPLAQVLALSPGWHCAHEDDAGVAALCVRE